MPDGGMTRAHTIAEWVSIQTGRGLVYQEPDGTLVKRNLSPADAAEEVRRLAANLKFRDLTGQQALDAVDALAKIPDLKGPVVHEFMHARAAEKHGASAIVTLNLVEFAKLTSLRLELPGRA